MLATHRTMLSLFAALSVAACSDSGDGATATASTSGSGGGTTTSAASTGGGGTGGTSSAGGGGGGPVDPCGDALFCEKFDDYAGVGDIADGQTFGPWRAALKSPGATMNLDGAHTVSGTHALHMSVETGVTAGGRLFADGDEPLFANLPTHVYGRMMMYVDPNGTSIHWTFFGASGDAEPSSPVAGRRATYLFSSLPKSGVNTYSFVYGLAADGTDPYHDCWFQSQEPQGAMPTGQWQCVEFELDSVARKLRMTADGGSSPTVAVDDHGQGCVDPAVPDDSPWYGPAIDTLYVGAWSFHDMDAPLEVWIDDLVVDTKPVSCAGL
ncbi:MAG TPA: hypothetical protein VL400_19150 [Polyangiaceae bacterium]|jgi:hypothetical protein|nr:hypothetical protein [Polyangiaceae bacterium]